jgi:hypothetical protein
MRANLLALNEILGLVATGQAQGGGAVAERELGVSAMGKHRSQPFDARPGPHMPPAMHAIGMDGHQAASEFARSLPVATATDDRRAAVADRACVACHYVYRLR